VGCGEARIPVAYLDLEKVASGDPLATSDASPPPKAPAPVAPTSETVPALPVRNLDFSANKARIEKVRVAVEESRNLTIREIARKLREAYLREVDVIEDKRLAEIDPIRGEALAKAWAQVRSTFIAYADARAPHAIRLALDAGFPDPDPNSTKPPDPDQKSRVRQFERARGSREKLADLDAEYERTVRRLIAGYDDEVADAITAIRIDIEKMRADAEGRAQADALAQVAKMTAQIESVLSGKTQVQLPGRPSRTSRTPAGGPVPEAPSVSFPTLAYSNQMRMEAVRSDAKIWAARVGVRLVETPSRAPDRTDEFTAWRKKRSLGP
jgi:hypothetical protein